MNEIVIDEYKYLVIRNLWAYSMQKTQRDLKVGTKGTRTRQNESGGWWHDFEIKKLKLFRM